MGSTRTSQSWNVHWVFWSSGAGSRGQRWGWTFIELLAVLMMFLVELLVVRLYDGQSGTTGNEIVRPDKNVNSANSIHPDRGRHAKEKETEKTYHQPALV